MRGGHALPRRLHRADLPRRLAALPPIQQGPPHLHETLSGERAQDAAFILGQVSRRIAAGPEDMVREDAGWPLPTGRREPAASRRPPLQAPQALRGRICWNIVAALNHNLGDYFSPMGFPSYETVKSGCCQVQGRLSCGYQLTGRKAPRADTSSKAWLPPRLAPPWLDPCLWPKPNIAMLPR